MNWNEVVADIKATGMTQAEIAEAVGIAAGTLSELCNGKVIEPKWSKGQAILALHAERCGDKKAA